MHLAGRCGAVLAFSLLRTATIVDAATVRRDRRRGDVALALASSTTRLGTADRAQSPAPRLRPRAASDSDANERSRWRVVDRLDPVVRASSGRKDKEARLVMGPRARPSVWGGRSQDPCLSALCPHRYPLPSARQPGYTCRSISWFRHTGHTETLHSMYRSSLRQVGPRVRSDKGRAGLRVSGRASLKRAERTPGAPSRHRKAKMTSL
jgi:hypothetical protein